MSSKIIETNDIAFLFKKKDDETCAIEWPEKDIRKRRNKHRPRAEQEALMPNLINLQSTTTHVYCLAFFMA